MDECNSIIDALSFHAQRRPSSIAYRFLEGKGASPDELSYRQLYLEVSALASRLQSLSDTGDRALLMYPPGRHYVVAFLACIMAGVVAVPLYPPRPNQKMLRTNTVMEDCGACLILTTEQVSQTVAKLQQDGAMCELQMLTTDNQTAGETEFDGPAVDPDAIAFLQYTSGSTGDPKGVILSNRNLVCNERAIAAGFGTQEDDVCLNWLPMYHDMGLIGSVLHPLYMGCISILMTPAAFIRDPMSWLEAIDKYRATICGAANFAFELLCQRFDAGRCAGLDLSSIKLMFSGAEPVRASTLARFAGLYGGSGFCGDCFYPCYGMAEATLFISGALGSKEVTVSHFDEQQLGQGSACISDDEANARALVGCGVAMNQHQIKIVDPETLTEKAEGEIGEIWFDGPSKAQGYWGRQQTNPGVFQAAIEGRVGEYLRTGDLGFIYRGLLYVAGRLKDVIIVRGRNYYPQDIEYTVASVDDGLNVDNCAAFAIERDGEEVLVAVQEVNRTAMRKMDKNDVIGKVQAAVTAEHQLEVFDVLLVKPGALAKTTSGKVQRFRNRQLYDEREFAPLASLRQPVGANETVAVEHNDPFLASVHQFVPLPAGVDEKTPLIALGIDSLKAASLCYALQQCYGVNLEFTDFLDDMSLETLRRKVVEAGENPSRAAEAVIEDQHCLSPLQRHLWASYMADQNASTNNLSVAFEVDESFDDALFDRALAGILADYPSLQVVFSVEDGVAVPRQTDLKLAIDYLDYDGRAGVTQQLAELSSAPFDLFEQLPLRVQMIPKPVSYGRILIFTIHHLVADYDSMTVLFDRLGQHYADCVEGRELERLPVRLGRFASYQEQWLAGQANARAEVFWSTYLNDFNPRVSLRTSRPRPLVRSYNGRSLPLAIDRALAQKLQALAKAHEVTPFTLMLTIYSVALSRISDQQDLTIGVPFSCAAGTEFEKDIGYHINALPVRFKHVDKASLSEMLKSVKKDLQSILQNRHFPSERVPGDKVADAAYAPLFQVMFSYYMPRHEQINLGPVFLAERVGLQLGGLKLDSIKIPCQSSQFDVSLSLAECDEGYVGEFEYNVDLFSAKSVYVWRDVLLTLCREIVAHEDCQPMSVSILNAQQLKTIRRWSVAEQLPSRAQCDPLSRIVRNCESHPDRTAMIYEGRNLSYGELLPKIQKLVAGLQSNGVEPHDRVAFHCGRHPDTILLMFALVQLGAAFVPLDPDASMERLQIILKAVAPKLVVVDGSLTAPESSYPEVSLERLGESPAAPLRPWSDDVIERRQACAYIFFTSGSTGVPKGVEVCYENLDYFIEWTLSYFDQKWFDKLLSATNFSFDVSIFETFSVLAAGGTLTLVKSIIQMPPSLDVNSVIGTSSTIYEALLEGNLQHGLPAVILTGEAPDEQTVRLLQEQHKVGQILNAYGPTEATIWATISDISTAKERITNIGQPVPGTQAWVVDRFYNLVPPGVEGELMLGGDGIARGYYNQPDISAQAFVCDGLSGHPGRLMYHTGDRAYWDHDGQLVFLGRRDNQVSIRGVRIELREVEITLRSLPGITQAAVIKSTLLNRDLLVAFVVLESGADLNEFAIFHLLSEKLSLSMLPSTIKLVDSLPINRNGKTDLKALAASLNQGSTVSSVNRQAPEGRADLLHYQLPLPAELTTKVRALAAKNHCAVSTVYLSAYCVLLGRWLGNDQLLISVQGYLERSSRVVCAELSRKPFIELMRQLDIPQINSVDETPHFGFVYDQRLHLFNDNISTGLSVCEAQDGLSLSWQLSGKMWQAFGCEQLVQAYQTLLRKACQSPIRDIGQLPLMSSDHWLRCTRLSHQPFLSVEYERADTAFDACVARYANSPALIWGHSQFSYGQLLELVEESAVQLRRHGIGSGGTVGVCLGNGIANVIALLALWRIGAVAVPMDPELPEKRIAYMLDNAEVQVCLVGEEGIGRGDSRQGFIVVDELARVKRVDGEVGPVRALPIDIRAPACIIYTSGSTGQPKGVMLTHDNLMSYAAAAKSLYGIGSDARVMQFSNVGFDIFVEELALSLLSGGALVIAKERVKSDAEAFWQQVEQSHITVVSLPTAFWHVLVEQMDESSARIAAEHLKVVVTGGEAISAAMVNRWLSLVDAKEVVLYNTYGPTETTVIATAHRITEAGNTSIPIGYAVDNACVLVLDSNRQPLPEGAVGELYIGGRGVAAGYLGEPKLSEQAFIDHPFVPGQKLYRTGDLVRMGLDDGLVFCGRNDHQVKINGFRIEPGEIEAAIESFEPVRRALVLGRPDDNGQKRLAAYLQWDGRAQSQALKQYLAESLPAYMLPKQWVDVESWPLTANGKIDRRALPQPEQQQSSIAYQNPTEQKLAAIVANLVGSSDIPIDVDFLSLGMDSLRAAKFLGEVRVAFDVKIDFKQLFEASDISNLARHIDNQLNDREQSNRSEQDDTMEILL